MPNYDPKSADMAVVNQAYRTATGITQDQKVLLALFEAGMVESNFQNLKTATDHDSLGYLQQRPSMGWPNPTDIPTATKSFVDRALVNEKNNPGYSAGQLAQSVQRSAYPDRYDQAQSAAQSLLTSVGKGGYGVPGGFGSPGNAGIDTGSGGLLSLTLPSEITGFLTDVESVISKALWLFNPSHWVRLFAGAAGIIMIIAGIFFLGREVRT